MGEAASAAGPSVRALRALPWASIDNDDSRDLDQLYRAAVVNRAKLTYDAVAAWLENGLQRTLVVGGKLEISGRLHYLWSSENDDPFVALGARDVQPGQAVHANVAASYEVAEGVRIGVSGYGLRQVTDDRIDGKSIPGSAEQVFGVGPGLRLGGRGVWVYLNGYLEVAAENRQQGAKVLLRLSKAL